MSKFVYSNCLNREYDDLTKNVNSITFDISRYGNYKHTIDYDHPVTEKKAIEDVEEFLSKPLTKDYYLRIKDDLFHEEKWKNAKEWFKCRGECLTDAYFLEISENKSGDLSLWCGS